MLLRLFTYVSTFANFMKISEAKFRKWIHDRGLRAMDVGLEWRILLKDLGVFLKTTRWPPFWAVA